MRKLNVKLTGKAKKVVISVSAGVAAAAIVAGIVFGLRGRGEPVGVSCLETINRYNFTKCFLGTNGIHTENGYTTHNIDEASVKRAVVQKSYLTYILADHSKFGKSAAVTFADIGNACILTDKLPDDRYKECTVVKEVGE